MRSGVILRMFTYRPRNLSGAQSETRRPIQEEQLEQEPDTVPEVGDEPEPADTGLAEEMETGQATDEEDTSPNQSTLSRSQKRRRHRR
jgi:hypothetical protein